MTLAVLAAIHSGAALDAAWVAHFAGLDMSWLPMTHFKGQA